MPKSSYPHCKVGANSGLLLVFQPVLQPVLQPATYQTNGINLGSRVQKFLREPQNSCGFRTTFFQLLVRFVKKSFFTSNAVTEFA